MIKCSEALSLTRTAVEEALVDAGLKTGLGLKDTEIKSEKTPLYWYIANTSEEGSKKATYIVYNVPQTTPQSYGDGTVLQRRPVVTIDIYLTSRTNDTLLANIESAFVDKLKNCELVNVLYSTAEKRFVYQYEVLLDVKQLRYVNNG